MISRQKFINSRGGPFDSMQPINLPPSPESNRLKNASDGCWFLNACDYSFDIDGANSASLSIPRGYKDLKSDAPRVAVDIRKSSPTYGQWVAETLSAENKKQLWIPEGFAHGFLTLSETAEFLYKTNNYYSFGSERCIRWNDGDLGILWPKHIGVSVSAKDASGITFENAEIFS